MGKTTDSGSYHLSSFLPPACSFSIFFIFFLVKERAGGDISFQSKCIQPLERQGKAFPYRLKGGHNLEAQPQCAKQGDWE